MDEPRHRQTDRQTDRQTAKQTSKPGSSGKSKAEPQSQVSITAGKRNAHMNLFICFYARTCCCLLTNSQKKYCIYIK